MLNYLQMNQFLRCTHVHDLKAQLNFWNWENTTQKLMSINIITQSPAFFE